MEDFSTRLDQLIQYLQITPYKLAKEIGTSESVISNVRAGRNKPSFDLLSKILNKYEVVSGDWLLTGVGPIEKYKEKKDSTPVASEPVMFGYQGFIKSSPPAKSRVSAKKQAKKVSPTLSPTQEDCRICDEKERVITQQQEVIDALKKVVAQMEARLNDRGDIEKKQAG